MENLKKKIYRLIAMINIRLPISKKTFYRQTLAISEIFKAHEEIQMMNRQDIMSLATLMSKTNPMINKKIEEIKEKKPNDKDVMYG